MPHRGACPTTTELVLAGAAVTLSGIGLARFAYTPLVPAMVNAGWFDAAAAAYLGAANLLGYLLGAIVAHRLAITLGFARTVRGSLVAVVFSFLLCAMPAPFAWFFLWRVVAGMAGALLMVLGPSAVLTAVPVPARAGAGTLVFTGVGVGALLSATVVPVLAARALPVAWLLLGGLALAATGVGWRSWAGLSGPGRSGADPDPRGYDTSSVSLVLLAYAAAAVGMVPHTVFWVDYVARGLDRGMTAGGVQWALFGFGTLSGPLLASWLARRLGYRQGLTTAFLLMAVGVALPLVTSRVPALLVSSFVVGIGVLAIVALISGRIAEMVGPARHRRVWGWATGTFAAGQAAAGYAMSALFDWTADYRLLFAAGGLALLAGAVCAATAGGRTPETAVMRE